MSEKNQMTKQRISQYGSLKREIAMLEEQILSADKSKDFVTDYAKDYRTGYPRVIALQGYGSSDVPKLIKRKSECIAECGAIESFIEGIQDSTLRQLFARRFIEGKSRREVAELIGYSEEYVSRLTNGYLKTKTRHMMSLNVT